MATYMELEELIYANNYKELQAEIELNQDIVFLVDEADWNLFKMCATCDAFECTEVLVKHGADINRKNKSGLTALMFAAYRNKIKATQHLLACGAETSLRNNNKESAFDIIMKSSLKYKNGWFNLFALYKDRFDEKDVARYHDYRLSALFA